MNSNVPDLALADDHMVSLVATGYCFKRCNPEFCGSQFFDLDSSTNVVIVLVGFNAYTWNTQINFKLHTLLLVIVECKKEKSTIISFKIYKK